ncbi:hypothetical protein H6F96_03945 [Microcoleus sp. FACHB-53]|nr:hypothetical protein [Microcoleus sp. FACHB-53]
MELEVARARCKDRLVWAIAQLAGKSDPVQIEKITELVIQTMTGPWRYFHTTEHIFEVGGSVDAIEILAALFHDIVYVQVDHGMNLNISRYLAPFILEDQGKLVIEKSATLPNHLMFEIVVAVFGLVPGETLSPFKGQNEFLSAVIAAMALEPVLSPSLIAQIVACIEATIPFRDLSESGLTPSERLYERLIAANHQFNFGWDEEQTIAVVKRSVRLVNRDVENFAFPNSADFLDNTWNLMPETNHELSNADSYTVQGYRRSLHKMEEFMNFLKPEIVFQQFMEEPDDPTYRILISQTQKNLEVARLYLAIKVITIAILEAISYRLGRNIPLSTLMGELPRPGTSTPTLAQFLPDLLIPLEPKTTLEAEVLALLIQGRNQESVYDLKNSPVATYIIRSIGFDSVGYLLKQAKAFFAGSISATDFLCQLKSEVLSTIINAVEQVFANRIEALRELSLDTTFSQTKPH